MLEQDINQKRKERHHITQEDFTPIHIVEKLCEETPEVFTDFSKTFLDPCAGIGNIFLYVVEQRLKNCNNISDVENAINTCYATELMDDNTEELKERLIDLIKKYNFEITDKVKDIINHNIVCTDFFKWDFENWCPIKENKCEALF